jgi:hypothetical protein
MSCQPRYQLSAFVVMYTMCHSARKSDPAGCSAIKVLSRRSASKPHADSHKMFSAQSRGLWMAGRKLFHLPILAGAAETSMSNA